MSEKAKEYSVYMITFQDALDSSDRVDTVYAESKFKALLYAVNRFDIRYVDSVERVKDD